MARKTKVEAKDTRSRILKAAGDLFYEKGVGGTTLEDIAESAGLTRGAIYWHFKNKLDLFAALHEKLHGVFMGHVIATRAVKTDTPLCQLATLSINMLEELAEDEDHRKALTIFTLKCDYSGDLEPFLHIQNEKRIEGMEIIRDLFTQAEKLGQLRKHADPDMLTLSFFCYMCGIMSEYLRNPSIFDMTSQSRKLVEQFFNSVSD